MPALLEDEDEDEEERTDAETNGGGEEAEEMDEGEEESTGDGEEEEEVAEVTMPGEDGEDASVESDGGDSTGVLGRINTKAIIVASAIVVGIVIVLRKIRGGASEPPQRQGRGREGNPNRQPEQQVEGEQSLEDQVTASDAEPLKQDEQMMQALNLGGSR